METFIFFRDIGWYPVEIYRDQVIANVNLNPGTLKVEDMQGNIVWEPSKVLQFPDKGEA